MSSTIDYPLFQATLAQGCGVTLALFGFLGVYFNKDEKKDDKWSLVRRGGIAIPFMLAYVTFFYGLIVLYNCNHGNPRPVDLERYMGVLRWYLYTNAILLPIMVACSGGVKQSIFSSLFFALPVMAVVFVPRSTISWLNQSPIFWVTAVTLVGYLVVYWCLKDDGHQRNFGYRICECLILVSSVVLTIAMSLWISPLL